MNALRILSAAAAASLLVFFLLQPSLSEQEAEGAVELGYLLIGLLLLFLPLFVAYGAASLPTPLARRARFTVVAAASAYLLVLVANIVVALTLEYELRCLSQSLNPDVECRGWAKAHELSSSLLLPGAMLAVALPVIARWLSWFGAQPAVPADGAAPGQ